MNRSGGPRAAFVRFGWMLSPMGVALVACSGEACPAGLIEHAGRCYVGPIGSESGPDAGPGDDVQAAGERSNGSGGQGGAPEAPEGPTAPPENPDDPDPTVGDEPDAGGEVDPCDDLVCLENATCEVNDGAGSCVCEPGYVHCPSEPFGDAGAGDVVACETHPASDPDNCGACGKVCAGELACVDGVCTQAAGQLVMHPYGACALLDPADGDGSHEVRCWGSNFANRLRDPGLGHALSNYRATPGELDGIGRVRGLATNYNHTCVLDALVEQVRCWGDTAPGALGSPSSELTADDIVDIPLSAKALSVGTGHSCALMIDGTVRCWGSNDGGQLGVHPNDLTTRATPTAVPGITDAAELGTGGVFNCVRTTDGRVACWGEPRTPDVAELRSGNATLGDAEQISVGLGEFVCIRRVGGALACWGSNVHGQLGNPVMPTLSEPNTSNVISVAGLSNVIDVSAGAAHACAVDESGQVWCWGNAEYLPLHVEEAPDDDGLVRVPSRVLGLDDAIDVEAGAYSTCARRRSGQVVCWGLNTHGQLGDGTALARDTARDVIGLP
jgi:alpha-tubulin suppressor-like RCC1 family protein